MAIANLLTDIITSFSHNDNNNRTINVYNLYIWKMYINNKLRCFNYGFRASAVLQLSTLTFYIAIVIATYENIIYENI